MLTDNKRCYLCGSVKFNRRAGSVRDKPELLVFECASCGLVFLSSFNHIKDDFYKNSKMHGKELLDVQAWLNDTLWDDQRRFQCFKPILLNRKLLDFGCGAGGFLLSASELATKAHGVEMEGRLESYFQTQGLTVFQSLSDIPEDFRGSYDVITMFHVLEHLPDPKSILSELSKFLVDGGQLIIEVPSADDALLTLYRCEPFSDFTYWSCHLFLYTVKTLKMLFDQSNLKVNYIKQVQRYPLSNHLYWLAEGKPGGHKKWQFLDSAEIHAAYEKQLTAVGKCDTIMACVSR